MLEAPCQPRADAHGLICPTVQPDAERWDGLLHRRPLPSAAAEFRRQLGLPTDEPVIMAGHQAEVWHPGILAKYLAAQAFAERCRGTTAWLIVDQDTNRPADIIFPVRTDAGRLERSTWRALSTPEDAPTALAPATQPAPLPSEGGGSPASEHVWPGLRQIAAALADRTNAPNVAMQMGSAMESLLTPYVAPSPIIYASRLQTTHLFRAIVERMKTDPDACARAYNNAASSAPETHVGPLAADGAGGGVELPLWRLNPQTGRRERVMSGSLGSIPPEQLAPRALLATGLMRLAACDLYIGGFGGAGQRGYAKVTDAWLHAWLGDDAEWRPLLERMAPATLVSATLLLKMDAAPVPPEQARGKVWQAHHARHDPSMLGDDSAADEKRSLVDRIERARTAGDSDGAAGLYRRMHDLLARVRSEHASELRALESDAAEARSRLADNAILTERTWAFPLYEPAQLLELRSAIDAAFGVARS